MAEHSKYYEKVKNYYDLGLWNKQRVRNAVTNPQSAPWITEDEYKQITDEIYNTGD